MAVAYTADLPRPAGFPAHLDVRVLVTRFDHKDLSAEDLAAAAQMYPPPDAEGSAMVEESIRRAKRSAPRTTKTKEPSAKRAASKSSSPRRKAAKKPTRPRAK
jgi:hypothetical protein